MKHLSVIFYLFIVIIFAPATSFAAHILVIESYHAQYPWDIGYKKALTEALGQNHTFSFFEMDTKRQPKNRILKCMLTQGHIANYYP